MRWRRVRRRRAAWRATATSWKGRLCLRTRRPARDRRPPSTPWCVNTGARREAGRRWSARLGGTRLTRPTARRRRRRSTQWLKRSSAARSWTARSRHRPRRHQPRPRRPRPPRPRRRPHRRSLRPRRRRQRPPPRATRRVSGALSNTATFLSAAQHARETPLSSTGAHSATCERGCGKPRTQHGTKPRVLGAELAATGAACLFVGCMHRMRVVVVGWGVPCC